MKITFMKKRILLADDDPGVRQMVGRVLESEHYDVVTAGTGREATAKFLANLPDLVLLDRDRPHLCPSADPWSAIVYSARGTDVRTVLVDGEVLVHDFALTRQDAGAVTASGRSAADELARRAGL